MSVLSGQTFALSTSTKHDTSHIVGTTAPEPSCLVFIGSLSLIVIVSDCHCLINQYAKSCLHVCTYALVYINHLAFLSDITSRRRLAKGQSKKPGVFFHLPVILRVQRLSTTQLEALRRPWDLIGVLARKFIPRQMSWNDFGAEGAGRPGAKTYFEE